MIYECLFIFFEVIFSFIVFIIKRIINVYVLFIVEKSIYYVWMYVFVNWVLGDWNCVI